MARSLSTAVAAIFSARAIGFVAAAFFTPIFVRLLGPESYGIYGTLMSLFALVNVFMSSGTNDSIRKFIAEDRSQQWKSAVFGFHVRLATLLAAIVALCFVGAAISPLVQITLGEEFVSLFYLLAIFSAGRQFRELAQRTMMGLKLEKYSEALQLIQQFGFRVGAIIALLAGLKLTGVFLADIFTSIFLIILSSVVLSRHLDLRAIFVSRSAPTFDRTNIIAYTGNTVAFIALLTTLGHVDVLMLSWVADSTTVGHYKGALMIVQVLWIFPQAVQLSMLQETVEHWQKENYTHIETISARVTRFVALVSILMAIGMAVLGDVAVPVYLGTEFKPAIEPLILLLPGAVGFAIIRPVLAINQASGHMRTLVIATLCAATINFIANLLLIPRYGMTGAAIATSLGYCSLPLVQSLAARSIGYAPFSDVPLFRLGVTAIVSGFLICRIDMFFSRSYLSMIIVPPIGAVVYTAIAIACGAVTQDDLQFVRAKIPI